MALADKVEAAHALGFSVLWLAPNWVELDKDGDSRTFTSAGEDELGRWLAEFAPKAEPEEEPKPTRKSAKA